MDHVHRQSGEYKTITYCCEDVIKKMLLQLIFKCSRCVCVCPFRVSVCTFAPAHNVDEYVRMLYNDEIKSVDVSGGAVAAVASINFAKFTHNYSLAVRYSIARGSRALRNDVFVRKFLEIKQK